MLQKFQFSEWQLHFSDKPHTHTHVHMQASEHVRVCVCVASNEVEIKRCSQVLLRLAFSYLHFLFYILDIFLLLSICWFLIFAFCDFVIWHFSLSIFGNTQFMTMVIKARYARETTSQTNLTQVSVCSTFLSLSMCGCVNMSLCVCVCVRRVLVCFPSQITVNLLRHM